MSAGKSTAGPWEVCGETIYGHDGYLIASVIAYYPENAETQAANARRIVQCVNTHGELVEALTNVLSRCIGLDPFTEQQARAALSKTRSTS